MTEPSFELPAPTASSAAAPAPDAQAQAAPTAATTTLVLEAPAPVSAVAPTQAAGAVPISAADRTRLDAMVASYLDAVATLDPHSQAFGDRVRDIGKLGFKFRADLHCVLGNGNFFVRFEPRSPKRIGYLHARKWNRCDGIIFRLTIQ